MNAGQHQLATPRAATELPKAATVDTSKVRLAGVKVLVIDDSKTIRRSAEVLLMQAGCEVILAEDGFDALEKISSHCPAIIFVDVLMPRLDGYQTCALIKRSAIHKHVPVIMLTSKDNLFDRARGRAAGSNQHLTKPFTKETLLQTVEAHVPSTHAVNTPLHS